MLIAWSVPVGLVVWLVRPGTGGRLPAGSPVAPDERRTCWPRGSIEGRSTKPSSPVVEGILQESVTRAL